MLDDPALTTMMGPCMRFTPPAAIVGAEVREQHSDGRRRQRNDAGGVGVGHVLPQLKLRQDDARKGVVPSVQGPGSDWPGAPNSLWGAYLLSEAPIGGGGTLAVEFFSPTVWSCLPPSSPMVGHRVEKRVSKSIGRAPISIPHSCLPNFLISPTASVARAICSGSRSMHGSIPDQQERDLAKRAGQGAPRGICVKTKRCQRLTHFMRDRSQDRQQTVFRSQKPKGRCRRALLSQTALRQWTCDADARSLPS